MQLDSIICTETVEDKLVAKHNATCREARQVLLGNPRVRFAERGHTAGQDVYAAFGRTWSGRYMAVFFIHKPAEHIAIIISAREMTEQERKRYGRK